MRGLVPGLPSSVPLAPRLPAVLQEDAFLQQFLLGFDESLAPVLATLDGLSSYVDPQLAPEDFLAWLAGWVGMELDDTWPLAQRREAVVQAAALHRLRGTVRGVAEAIRLGVGGLASITVRDNGGAAYSTTAGAALPGSAAPRLLVTVVPGTADSVDLRRLEAIVAGAKPAHIPHSLEVKDHE